MTTNKNRKIDNQINVFRAPLTKNTTRQMTKKGGQDDMCPHS